MEKERLIELMKTEQPVMCKGRRYKAVNALIYRRITDPRTGRKRCVAQAELQSMVANSVETVKLSEVEEVEH